MIPNQAHKMSSGSIVRQKAKDETPEGSHTMPDGTVMLDSEHEVDKHATHDQSSHGGGGRGGAPKLNNDTKTSRGELETAMESIQAERKDLSAERSGLDRELKQAKGQAKMATTSRARASAKTKIPKLESRLSAVDNSLSDLDSADEQTQLKLDELRFR